MDKIRILQVVTIMNRGGAETLLMNLYRNIDRTKIQFDFLTHRMEKGAYDDEIISLGGRIFHFPPIRPLGYRKYFKELDNFFLQHPEYKIVHSHINENSSFVLRAANKSGVPIRVAHSHLGTLPIDYKIPFRYYGRYFLRENATHYFACSTDAGRWLFGRDITDNRQVTVLKNGVDYTNLRFNKESREKIRHEMGIEDKLVISHIGRFEEQKNHSFLIDVFDGVIKRNPNAILLLIGDGKLKSSIIRKVERLGLKNSVRFLGIRSDVCELMQAMDIFLFPSKFEGLPVALVEAQGAGLHCIVSDAITKESDIGAGLLQFIDLKESKSLWADKVIATEISHIDVREALDKSGFNIIKTAKTLQSLYIDLLANKGDFETNAY